MEESRIFGRRLRKWRVDKNLTQEQLAERSGVKREIITMVENGRQRSTNLDNVVKIADALGISLDMLVRIDPPEKGAREKASELEAALV